MNALVVPLTLTKRDFQTNAESARLDMERLKSSVGQVNGELTVMQREARASGGATETQTAKIKELRAALKGLSQDLRTAKADYKILSEVAPPTAPITPAAPVKVTTQTMLGGSRATQPAPVRVSLPETKPAPKSPAEPEDEPPEKKPNNRMRNMELGHVARAAFDSLASGQSPTRILEQEAPRLVQAFGSSLGGIIKFLGPLGLTAGGVAVALGTAVKVLSTAHGEAVRLSEQIDRSGRPQASLGGDTVEAARTRLESKTDPIAALQEKVDSGVGNFFSNLTEGITNKVRPATQAIAGFYNQIYQLVGLGGKLDAGGFILNKGTTREEALEQAKAQQAVELSRVAVTQGRDNKLAERTFSEGSDNTAFDRLEEEFKKRKDEIERLVAANPAIGDTALVQGLRDEITLREKIAGIMRDTVNLHHELEHTVASISHPGIEDENRIVQTLPPEDRSMRLKPIQKLAAERDAAVEADRVVTNQGGDSRKTHEEMLRKESALREKLIDEELKTPAQRQRDTDQQRRRQQAEDRLVSRAKRSGEVDAANRGNFSDFFSGNRHMAGPEHMPDRSFRGGDVPSQPNRQVSAADTKARPAVPLVKLDPEMAGVLKEIRDNCKFMEQ